MTPRRRFDLCVIGGGAAGLSVAAGAVQMGASVALIERGRMGGDCLNFGCVPSKALLAAGRATLAARQSERFGIYADVRQIDGKRVYEHVHAVIAAIAPQDSVERFEKSRRHRDSRSCQVRRPRRDRGGWTPDSRPSLCHCHRLLAADPADSRPRCHLLVDQRDDF